ncbi:MAG TPA: STAS domain-containing protein [Streptosporangiaceae bacterium]|jgi:anti-anti-sigma factor
MPAGLQIVPQAAVPGADAEITIRGELDLTAAAALEQALERLRGTTSGGLVLQLGTVAFIDCACARVIARAASTWPGPGRVVLRDPSPAVRRVFQLTGLAAAVQLDPAGPPLPAPVPAQRPAASSRGTSAARTQEHGPAARDDHPGGSGLGPGQLAALLGTPVAEVYRARELGLLPGPGPSGRWGQAATAEITSRWPQTAAALAAARELGTARSAELLARASGLPITAAHVAGLAARGLLTSARSYKHRPLYRIADLHALAADPDARALLAELTTPAGAVPDPPGGARP